jgi:hypothetical protein
MLRAAAQSQGFWKAVLAWLDHRVAIKNGPQPNCPQSVNRDGSCDGIAGKNLKYIIKYQLIMRSLQLP